MELDLALILVVIDISTETVYAIDAKKYIRENYNELTNKNTDTKIFKIYKTDIFTEINFLLAYFENEKYKRLIESSFDSFIIFNFIKYFADIGNMRDFFLPVEDYDDCTNEILNFIKKYKILFMFNSELDKKSEEIFDFINPYLLKDGINMIDYYECTYIEQARLEFNKKSFNFFVKLIKLICEEIEKDETKYLSKLLYKFPKLYDILSKYNENTFFKVIFDDLEFNFNSDNQNQIIHVNK